MRTTVTIDDELLAEAAEITGITERSALLRHALESLIETDAARQIVAMGGTDPHAWAPGGEHDPG